MGSQNPSHWFFGLRVTVFIVIKKGILSLGFHPIGLYFLMWNMTLTIIHSRLRVLPNNSLLII